MFSFCLETRWGQLPYLTINGKELAQSVTMARYVARKFNLAGKTPLEEAYVDEIIDAIGDLKAGLRPLFYEPDEAKKEEGRKTFVSTTGTPFLDKITDMKKNNGGKWLVGTSFTWADICVALMIEMFELHINPEGMKSYGVLHQLKEDVNSQPGIKEWIIKRPVTQF
jgi:glutathione S-transferase